MTKAGRQAVKAIWFFILANSNAFYSILYCYININFLVIDGANGCKPDFFFKQACSALNICLRRSMYTLHVVVREEAFLS